MAEDRDIVDKVSDEGVSPVETARTQVKSPPRIGIGYVSKISRTASGGGVNGARVGIENSKLQVFDLRVQVHLQGIVMGVCFIF